MNANRFLAMTASLLACACAYAGVLSTMRSVPAVSERRYDAATLKPAELKSCLVDAYTIDTADALFEAERPKVEEERVELSRLRDIARGKPTSASAAADSELRAKARAFNERIAALNSRVAYAQDARERFSRTCKERQYYVDDFAAARRQLPREVRDVIAAPR